MFLLISEVNEILEQERGISFNFFGLRFVLDVIAYCWETKDSQLRLDITDGVLNFSFQGKGSLRGPCDGVDFMGSKSLFQGVLTKTMRHGQLRKQIHCLILK